MADKHLLSELKGKGSLVSFKAHKDLQRGALLEITGMAESILGASDYELYAVKDATATTERGNLLVHNSVVKQYDERLTERDFELKQDEAGRGRNPEAHCVHLIVKALVTGTVVAGDKLKLGAGVFEKATEGDAAIVVVEEVLNWKGQDSVTVRYL